MLPEACPSCKRSLEREDEPGFTNAIAHYAEGVYDGVLWWECPYCHHAWPRFSDGSRKAHIGQQYASEHNWMRDLKKEGG